MEPKKKVMLHWGWPKYWFLFSGTASWGIFLWASLALQVFALGLKKRAGWGARGTGPHLPPYLPEDDEREEVAFLEYCWLIWPGCETSQNTLATVLFLMSLGDEAKPLQTLRLARTVGLCSHEAFTSCYSVATRTSWYCSPRPWGWGHTVLGSHSAGMTPGSVTEQPYDLGKWVSPCAADWTVPPPQRPSLPNVMMIGVGAFGG